nr:hypothetical protein [Nanoarchaeota archaeon]
MKKRGKSKAQVSMEFLIIIGLAFLMTIPLIIVFYQQSETLNTDITTSQIDKVANKIRDASDEVYYLGSPSKKTVTVFMPEGVQSISISGNKIIFIIDSPSGDYELVKWSAANLSGSIQTYKGIHYVSVESHNTYVSISD